MAPTRSNKKNSLRVTIILGFVNKTRFSGHLGARQHAHALEPQDHEAVADGDDEDGHDEGEDEHADLQQRLPVPGGVGENHLAVHVAVGRRVG